MAAYYFAAASADGGGGGTQLSVFLLEIVESLTGRDIIYIYSIHFVTLADTMCLMHKHFLSE